MKIVDKKPYETPPNYFYGIDVTDKEAVKKEYHRLKYRRFLTSILVLVVIFVLGIFAFDAIRVNYYDGEPILYKKSRVDGGYLYKGVGYGKLYCDNGNKYLYVNKKNKCVDDVKNFEDLFLLQFKEFAIDNEIINIDRLESLVINDIVNDGKNNDGGYDYSAVVSYLCVDGSDKCFKKLKPQEEYGSYKLFVSFNNLNKITKISTFKTYGDSYDFKVQDYTTKLKDYFVLNNLLDVNNVRYFDIKILSNHGRIKYKDNYYYDSYKVTISYTCFDNSNTCVNKDEFTYDNDLYFNASVFVDKDDNIVLVKNEAILDL